MCGFFLDLVRCAFKFFFHHISLRVNITINRSSSLTHISGRVHASVIQSVEWLMSVSGTLGKTPELIFLFLQALHVIAEGVERLSGRGPDC